MSHELRLSLDPSLTIEEFAGEVEKFFVLTPHEEAITERVVRDLKPKILDAVLEQGIERSLEDQSPEQSP